MKLIDMCHGHKEVPMFICDVSPPRGPEMKSLNRVRDMDADLVCVAYNPGKSVRADSTMLAAVIKNYCGNEVIFTIATRDMNRLAIQSSILGAQLLGLDNVVVVGGDPFDDTDLTLLNEPNGFTSTGLIRSLFRMNNGLDYSGRPLDKATDLCIGASIDLGKAMVNEVDLTIRKVNAGAEFFITQPVFDVDDIDKFCQSYANISGSMPKEPIFWGVQILVKNGICFSEVPNQLTVELENGRPGTDIALEIIEQFRGRGINRFYLIPPIKKGGERDYGSAETVLELARQ